MKKLLHSIIAITALCNVACSTSNMETTPIKYTAQTNPYLAPAGSASMHADGHSSDATPAKGPGATEWDIQFFNLEGTCPTVMVGTDGFILTMNTSPTREFPPRVLLLDPNTGEVLSKISVAQGSLLGGTYAYMDHKNRVILVDGNSQLLRIAHSNDGKKLFIDEQTDLSEFMKQVEGDAATSLMPDFKGRVWIGTGKARVAMVDENGKVHGIDLGSKEETIDNSISTAPEGVGVTTSHAMYLLNVDENGAPKILWRKAYDRGSHRKPGQLSWGTGASPTFFGPNGSDFVMLTDNADRQENLIIHRTKDGEILHTTGIFEPGASGTECSMIGVGNMVIGESTYGYPYPAYPESAGKSVPENAPFAPGLARWDITPGGLQLKWKKDIYSATVPRLACGDGIVYLYERKPEKDGKLGKVLQAMAVDAATGEILHAQSIPGDIDGQGLDPIQMVGVITEDGVWWQGTLMGMLRIKAKKK